MYSTVLLFAIQATSRIHLWLRRRQQSRLRRLPPPRPASLHEKKLEPHQRRWIELLQDRLAANNYSTVWELAAAHPWARNAKLGELLGLEPQDHFLISWGLLRDAERFGLVEYFARDQLVRYLHNKTVRYSDGTSRGGMLLADFDVAIIALIQAMPSRYRCNCYRVAAAYSKSDLASNWRPVHPEDLDLIELFSAWNEPVAPRRNRRTERLLTV